VYYTVQPGDTLMAIAWRFGVSQAAIMRANNLSNANFLYVGQRLVIPGAPAPTSRPRLSLKPAKVAFARWDGYKHDLYIANLDGSDERLLLERAAGPSWSPDGRHLSIFGEEGVDRQLLNGTPLVFEGISNGVMIASVAGRPDDPGQLNLIQIEREGSARATAWASNGQMIAWDAKPGGGFYIYFHGFEKTDFESQSAIQIPGEQPDWSPDSSHLVYRSGRNGDQGLWISDRYDSVPRRITDNGSDSFPRWSPDGRWIAFQREADGNVDIYLMPVPGFDKPGPGKDGPGGMQIQRLTNAPGPDTLPAWTPDGHILFRSTRTGSWAIFVMKPDGGDQQPLFPNADPGPDWAFGRMDVHALN
jgi:Tol biopolymer transport system component